jgi:hypothetical protein
MQQEDPNRCRRQEGLVSPEFRGDERLGRAEVVDNRAPNYPAGVDNRHRETGRGPHHLAKVAMFFVVRRCLWRVGVLIGVLRR